MADTITNINQQLIGSVTNIKWLNVIGWIVLVIIVLAAIFYFFIVYRNKKQFNKKITVFEIVGGYYCPAFKDTAKVVKIGTGGFEILYLKKSKTWKIAYGGRVGRDTYYFFIAKDGYWYNGMLDASMSTIDKNGGLISVVTTNPAMRAQYTSLEKQIDALHSDKKSFMEKYGSWVLAIGFVLVAGVMLWLNYKEFVQAMNALAGTTDKLGQMIDKANTILGNSAAAASGGQGGLIPV